MTATIFIFVSIFIIAVFDIWLGVKKKKYITDIFRGWYKTRPFAPFAVGFLCIGHFSSIYTFANVPLFIISALLFLAWCIVMQVTEIKFSRKFYQLNCKIFLIPMFIGSIVGLMWH